MTALMQEKVAGWSLCQIRNNLSPDTDNIKIWHQFGDIVYALYTPLK
jgi:hypothetical protein